MTTHAPPHRLADEAVEELLASGRRRRELVAFLGEGAYRELSDLARRARATRRAGPLVYVLPGLTGSRIGSSGKLLDDVIWLDLVEVAAGHLTRLALPRGARLVPLGVMLLNALKLKLSLQVAGFDARFHAYDWRRSVEELARGLNARIGAEGGRDVLLVGHSMGGVVARLALASDPGRIARVVQIGAPNRGSFAPVLAMRAVYPTVRKLAALDLRHDAEDLARIVFRTLPSLHELLPEASSDGELGLFDPAAWPEDALRPDRALLDDAASARGRWPAADLRCLHIVGVRQDTVTRAELHRREFHYTLERDGDGTVPTRLAMLEGARHWFVAEKHGGLPNNGKVIAAVADLLRTGDTERLPAVARRAASRGARTISESVLRRIAPRKVRWQELSPDARRRLLEPVVSPEFHGAVTNADLRPKSRPARSDAPVAATRVVELRLVRGSIADANAHALVLGLFRNVDPSGASRAIDVRLDGAIREFVRHRRFGAGLGEVTSLPVAHHALLAEFVILAGLGDFDDFGSEAQSRVAGRVVRHLDAAGIEDFATVLFGTGSGIPVAAALEQQLRGFISGLQHAGPDSGVRRITICELDARRYAALRRAARSSAEALSDARLRIVVDESETASAETPARARLADASRRDPVYLLVALAESGRSDYECRSSVLTAGPKAAVLSGSARISRKRLRSHLALAESGRLEPQGMARFGRELARLLLPASVRDGLATMPQRPLVLVHDSEGSRIPWEALHIGESHPALTGGLTRRYASDALTVARWNERRAPGSPLRVLMVVDPTLDLAGAADEGATLSRLLEARGAEVELLTGAAATRKALLREFGSGRHDVLHFAGHGYFDAGNPGRSGLVCAGRETLRGADLDDLANLPSLVFFNACEAARVRRSRADATTRLFAFRRSTSVAEAFLGGGVANFLGTHWPVGDLAARMFATSFYERVLDGAPLGDCTLTARHRVRDMGSIDWADYVLYGVPDFRVSGDETG